MTDQVDDLLNDLKAAIDVAPSPEFLVRVRRASTSLTMAQTWWRSPVIVAAATVAIAATAVVVSRPQSSRHPSRDRVMTTAIAPPPTAAAPLAIPRSYPGVARTTASDVLIPPGDMAAARAMLQAMERGDLQVPAETPLELDGDGRVKPFEIPLVVIEPLSGPQGGSEKGIGS